MVMGGADNLISGKRLSQSRLSKARLRFWFIAFFLALAIPAGILGYTAFEKQRWEIFHQYQKAAQFLSLEINSELSQAIVSEEKRSDTDYTFLVLEGEPQTNFLQRSVLSQYPVESHLPGIIGYFQIDSNGRLSSPVLPQDEKQASLYGISAEDKLLRKQLLFSLHHILSENELLSSNNIDEETVSLYDEAKQFDLAERDTQESRNNLPIIETEASDYTESKIEKAIEDDARKGRDSEMELAVNSEESLNTGFSQLQSPVQQKKILKDLGAKAEYSHQSDLENSRYENMQQSKLNQLATTKRAKRKEQNYYPRSTPNTSIPEEAIVAGESLSINELSVSLFESEIEPFKFSLLKSGHFVVYRQVWRNNQRLIQGAILSLDEFFNQAIKPRFQRSPLSDFTRLEITYNNNLLMAYPQLQTRYTRRAVPVNGELLSSINLSEPFGQLSLVFHVVDMSIGESGLFILVIAGSLLMALVFGTFSLYRLSRKQSYLAQQHQDFISSVSHELKTPITSIKMYGEILKQGWATQSKKEEYYDFIHSESERLSRLISNILQISKINRNSLKLSLKPVTVRELRDVISSKTKSQIIQSGFQFDLLSDANLDDEQVAIDIDSFIQIIINLVDNAIKYSAQCAQKKIEISLCRNEKSKLQISVRDYGPGVDKDKRNKIFELFYRVGNELTRESKGTGIGLALVKEMTLQMNGEVKVKNREVGAEFFLIFPLV